MTDTKTYRLVDGKKHNRPRDGSARPARMVPGETVELNERQAYALRDKFAPVDGVGFANVVHSPGPKVEPSPARQPPKFSPPKEPVADYPSPDPDDHVDDVEEFDDAEVQASHAKDLIERIEMSGDAALIKNIVAAEEAGKGRVSVLNAGDDRLEELGAKE